ncbi:MAG TPA: hypothetical protein RMH99_18675 [Sandaracinaceae bacterium LLY-WYZ-13_1]|nr:hypothetical protein [Sandaracinaceae bacterium LLY-WYZ-13_1]
MRPKKLRRRGFLAWLRDVAGNATTETVIMIPVFVGIWGGIWYTHGRYRKAQNMAQFTRAHAWAHAYAGCEGSAGGSTSIGERGSDSSGFIDGVVSLLFGSGILPGFQFDEIEGRRSTSIERPAVLGEGSVSMGHNLVVMCNERTQEDFGAFEAAAGMFGFSF